jgi:hypothetical protein
MVLKLENIFISTELVLSHSQEVLKRLERAYKLG